MAEGQPELNAENSWVEENGEKAIIMYARELSFTGGDDERCWLWHSLVLATQGQLGIEVPKLMGTHHLEVHGKLEMSRLTPGAKYQVCFLVMLQDPAEGWESCPVTVKLKLLDGSCQEHQVNLSDLPKNQLTMVVVGHFVGSSDTGEIIYSMLETSKVMKKGLVVKDVAIRPLPEFP